MAGTGLQPVNIFLIIFPFLVSFLVVSIRIWRKIKERTYAIEDTLLVVAEAILVALTATMWKFILVSYAGYHSADIPEGAPRRSDVTYWRHTNNVVYNPILGLAKISFLITLLKLRCMDRLIIASLWTLIAINIMFIISSTLGSLFMCWPIQKAWHSSIDGTCGDRAAYVFGTIGVTIITDVLVSLIPAWVLYDLRMPLKNKVFVIGFLSLPLTVTAIGCYRLHKFVEVMALPTIYVEDPYNIRSVLSNVEANLGVIAACGPTIKWMLSRFIPYFDTSPSRNPFPPNSFPRFQWRTRESMKGAVDIELQEHYIDTNNDDQHDASRDRQFTTISSDSQKTATAQDKGDVMMMEEPGLHLQVNKPKPSFQPGN